MQRNRTAIEGRYRNVFTDYHLRACSEQGTQTVPACRQPLILPVQTCHPEGRAIVNRHSVWRALYRPPEQLPSSTPEKRGYRRSEIAKKPDVRFPDKSGLGSEVVILIECEAPPNKPGD